MQKLDRGEKFKGRRVDLNVTCTNTAADLMDEDGTTQMPNTVEEKLKIVLQRLPEYNRSGENVNHR